MADDGWRISIAVAGFADDDLAIEVKGRSLHVTARKAEDEAQRKYLHRGIATRAFERRFHLADHVRVTGASHENGMLHIDLTREVPESLKPRRIEIAAGGKKKRQPRRCKICELNNIDPSMPAYRDRLQCSCRERQTR